jgi:hypothetical protein
MTNISVCGRNNLRSFTNIGVNNVPQSVVTPRFHLQNLFELLKTKTIYEMLSRPEAFMIVYSKIVLT